MFARRPNLPTCRFCGRQTGSASLAFHEKACYKKHLAMRETLSPEIRQRLEAANAPPSSGHRSRRRRGIRGKHSPRGRRSSQRSRRRIPTQSRSDPSTAWTRQEYPDEPVAAATASSGPETFLLPCKYCTRRFFMDRIEKHESCCIENPRRRSGSRTGRRSAFNSQQQRLIAIARSNDGTSSNSSTPSLGPGFGFSSSTPSSNPLVGISPDMVSLVMRSRTRGRRGRGSGGMDPQGELSKRKILAQRYGRVNSRRLRRRTKNLEVNSKWRREREEFISAIRSARAYENEVRRRRRRENRRRIVPPSNVTQSFDFGSRRTNSRPVNSLRSSGTGAAVRKRRRRRRIRGQRSDLAVATRETRGVVRDDSDISLVFHRNINPQLRSRLASTTVPTGSGRRPTTSSTRRRRRQRRSRTASVASPSSSASSSSSSSLRGAVGQISMSNSAPVRRRRQGGVRRRRGRRRRKRPTASGRPLWN